jgi:hypothetical protein
MIQTSAAHVSSDEESWLWGCRLFPLFVLEHIDAFLLVVARASIASEGKGDWEQFQNDADVWRVADDEDDAIRLLVIPAVLQHWCMACSKA